MFKFCLAVALSLLALAACAPQQEPGSEADRIAAGVTATLEARRIEAAISATLEAIATSTPVPTLQRDVIVITNPPGEDDPRDLLDVKVGTHKSDSGAPSSLDLEREALVRIFEDTGGESWNLSDNWLSDRPVGEWFGVVTNSDGRVTELILRYNILNGELPAELGNLTELRVLSLGGTGLRGEIPGVLGNLSNLVELWLWGNELSGEIPPELGSLTNLEILDLSGNHLQGRIPQELGNLTGLKQLRLWENGLSGEIPHELGSLTGLKTLGLSWNQLSGGIPAELGNLTALEWLDLANNQLSGEIPEELGGLSNLVEIYLHGNQLTGCVPSPLQDQLISEPALPFCPTGSR